jgi:hypothetical protein
MKDIPDWWVNRQEVIATLHEVYHQPETVFNYHFFVDGIKYYGGYGFSSHQTGIIEGSKYYVAYNPENPKDHIILLHKPVFEEYEKTGYAVAQCRRGVTYYNLPNNVFGYDVWEFPCSYTVNGRNYKRVYFFILNDRNFKVEDIIGKKFKVKYWEENQWRSIILLDQPINL